MVIKAKGAIIVDLEPGLREQRGVSKALEGRVARRQTLSPLKVHSWIHPKLEAPKVLTIDRQCVAIDQH